MHRCIQPIEMSEKILLEEGKIYKTSVYKDGGNWVSVNRPKILSHHILGFVWENEGAFSMLKNAQEGDKKEFIFSVIKIDTSYSPRKTGSDFTDSWKDIITCRILEIS